MSYTVFARKYRPQTFDDVVGQDHITRTLKNAIEQNRLAHAYIFVGPRGTGKTSTARILAKALNCQRYDAPTTTPCGECDACREIAAGTSLDVLEFDAASNTQVDKVRELIIDNVRYAPTRGRYKVYIVDEVHMLSTSSFNALLKTLEEPPNHVKFVFATTDVQKVPMTILSRCQRFDLKRIPTALIANHLRGIAEKESMNLSPEAAEAVARGAEGGMRDAESMLDQLVAFCGQQIDECDVQSVFGITTHETVSALCDHIISGDAPRALGIVHEQAEAGRDLSRLLGDLIDHLRNLLVAQADPQGLAGELSDEAVAALVEQSGRLRLEKLLDLIEQFGGTEQRMKWASNKRMHFEIAVIKAIQTLSQATLGEVLDTISALRDGGVVPALPPRPAPPAPITAKPAPEKPAVRSTPTPAVAPSSPVVPAAATPPPPKPAAPVAKIEPIEVKPAKPAKAAELVDSPFLDEPAPEPPPVKMVPEPIPAKPLPAAEESAPPEPMPVQKPASVLARAEAPAKTEEPSTATPAVTDAKELWTKLTAEVRKRRPLIAMWVEAGAALSFAKGVLTAGFPPDQSLAADYCSQKNNREFIEALASDFAGTPVTLRTTLQEGLQVAPPAPVIPEKPKDPMEEFKNDPLIQRALEVFRGEIQPA